MLKYKKKLIKITIEFFRKQPLTDLLYFISILLIINFFFKKKKFFFIKLLIKFTKEKIKATL